MILTIANQKGGCSKTTSTVNIGFALKHKGYKVLFVDLDAQGNLTSILNAQPDKTVLEVLLGEATLKEAILSTDGVDLLASDNLLYNVESKLEGAGKEHRLKEALENHGYDFVLIDTPPSMNLLSINALVATDKVMIPLLGDVLSLEGLTQLSENVEGIKKYYNPNLDVLGLFFTNFKERTNIAKTITEFAESATNQLNTRLFKSKIRECVKVKESQLLKQDLFTYAPKSNASEDYINLTNEILEVVS